MFVVEQSKARFFFQRSFLLGVIFALLYLLFTVFRMARRKKVSFLSYFTQFIEDVLFAFLLSFFNILLIFSANRGQIRLIALLLEMAGFWVGYRLLHTLFEKMSRWALNFIKVKILIPERKLFKKLQSHMEKRREKKRLQKYGKNIGKTVISIIEKQFSQLSSDKES